MSPDAENSKGHESATAASSPEPWDADDCRCVSGQHTCGKPNPDSRTTDSKIAATDTRCPETSTEGARCIYGQGHDGDHFAKDSFSYYSWPTERRNSDAARRRCFKVVHRWYWWRGWRYCGWCSMRLREKP